MPGVAQKRNYFSEINSYLKPYGIKLLDIENQDYHINYGMKKLHQFFGEQFEIFWKQLLIRVHHEIEELGKTSYVWATWEGVSQDGTLRIYDVSFYFIYRIVIAMEKSGVIRVEGESNTFFACHRYDCKPIACKTYK